MFAGDRGFGEDRRIFERFEVDFPGRLQDLVDNRKMKAKTKDISAQGVCMVVKEEIKEATPLKVWLNFPDKKVNGRHQRHADANPYPPCARQCYTKLHQRKYSYAKNYFPIDFFILEILFQAEP